VNWKEGKIICSINGTKDIGRVKPWKNNTIFAAKVNDIILWS